MPCAFNSGTQVPSIDVIQSRDVGPREPPRDDALQAHLAGQEDRGAVPAGPSGWNHGRDAK
jgi:hypothetical protein